MKHLFLKYNILKTFLNILYLLFIGLVMIELEFDLNHLNTRMILSNYLYHVKDPLIMASLQTVQQVQLQKPPAPSPTRGKWNSMHAQIARYIQEQQNKSKIKKRFSLF